MARPSNITVLSPVLLPALKVARNSTAKELGVTTIVVNQFIEANLIKQTGTRRVAGRGRPAHEFGLTDKGRKRATRIEKVVA